MVPAGPQVMRWVPLIVYLSIFLGALCVDAEEAPCRAVEATVVCTRPGFDALVAKTLDARQAAERCKLEREADAATARVVEARLALVTSERELALARVRELEARPFPRGRMLAAAGLGAVAGLAAGLSAVVSSDRAGYALWGVAATGATASVVLVLME